MGLCNSSYSTFCRVILCYYPQNYYTVVVRFFGNLAIGFTYGFIVAIINPNYDENKLENSATLIGLVTAPLLAKKGIEKARKYGKEKIDSN